MISDEKFVEYCEVFGVAYDIIFHRSRLFAVGNIRSWQHHYNLKPKVFPAFARGEGVA